LQTRGEKAIPVFVEFLKNEEFDSTRTKEMLVRALTVKEAKGVAREFIRLILINKM
jgi:hypothetical protein